MKYRSMENRFCMSLVAFAVIVRLLLATGVSAALDSAVGLAPKLEAPDEPDVFLLAASRLGVDPRDCYVFEDSPNGVRAGVKAGMRTIMVPDLMPVTDDLIPIAYGIFMNLSEAQDFLEKEI